MIICLDPSEFLTLKDYHQNVLQCQLEADQWNWKEPVIEEPEDSFPEFLPGQISWALLRRIRAWEARQGFPTVSLGTLNAYQEEGYRAAQAGLDLGLIDYGQASGWSD